MDSSAATPFEVIGSGVHRKSASDKSDFEEEEDVYDPNHFNQYSFDLLEMFHQFLCNNAAIYKELGSVKMKDATALHLATALSHRFYGWLWQVEEHTVSPWPRHVAKNLCELKVADGGVVNVLATVLSFLRARAFHRDADFASATFGSKVTVVHGKKFDRDYDLPYALEEVLVCDASPMDLLRAFRSTVNRSVRKVTKSWETPNFEEASTWRYTTSTGEEKTSEEFLEFMKLYTITFVSLERLSKPLKEVFDVFTTATKKAREEGV
jgi:hypothetical protein